MEKHPHVATILRQLREGRRLSIAELAEECQIHPKLIEELESGEHVSSIAPLVKIARGLGVPLSTFIDDAPTDRPVITRAGELESAVEFSGAGSYGFSMLEFCPLAKNKKNRHMEPFIIDLHPPVPEETTFSFHEGEEFIEGLKEEIREGGYYEEKEV